QQPRNEERNSKKNGRWTRKKSGSESQEPRLADFSAACEAVPYKTMTSAHWLAAIARISEPEGHRHE
ncbi:MAG: hypothetical protein WCA19_22155, partial [Candidatus Acidiferrales bacterium]